MTERYDTATAGHYAAYRPPLHRLILQRVIKPSESFQSGLDAGCGTGYSAVALADYCDRVCGVDASEEMLALAEEHPRFSYVRGTPQTFEGLPDRPYDIVTFAGSLFYMKSEDLRTALKSVCASSATVIVYDFEVLIDKLMDIAGVTGQPGASDYDHDTGLCDWEEFEAESIESERLRIDASAAEAAHVLLSDSFRYDALQRTLGKQELFENLTHLLESQDHEIFLEADTWSKRYRLIR